MLKCKVCEGKEDSFVRDIKAPPDPQCVLFADWQVSSVLLIILECIVFLLPTQPWRLLRYSYNL